MPPTPATDPRVVVVTGVSRRTSIGFAIARRAIEDGAAVLLHSFAEADSGAGEVQVALAELGGESERLCHLDSDLADPAAPWEVIAQARKAFGAVDALVVSHAHGSECGLSGVTADELDRSWAVNARAPILLAQAFVASHEGMRPDPRIVFLTSGQHLGPMTGELPYVLGKGAVQQATATLAAELAELKITVNAVNPGPVDTGWPSTRLRERLAASFPARRMGSPEDVAPVIAWLLSAESAQVTGQVIDAEGGFRRG